MAFPLGEEGLGASVGLWCPLEEVGGRVWCPLLVPMLLLIQLWKLMSIPANTSMVERNQSPLQINTMMAKENGVLLFLGSGKTGLLLICFPNPCFYLQNEFKRNPEKPIKACLLAGRFLDHVTILLWFFWLGKKSAKGKILYYVIFLWFSKHWRSVL